MCDSCWAPLDLSRRKFFKLASAGILGWSVLNRSFAAAPSAPPKPENVIGPDAALQRLMKGNQRYVEGTMKRHDFIAERPALAMGQNPFAGILSCADSRVAPEYTFDTGRGDVFICRVAGNFANDESIASFEYGVAVLGLPLIVVLGHGSCGAVASTIKVVKEGAFFPGHIPTLISALKPAVKASLHAPGDLLANSTKENVRLNVEKLKNSRPILSQAIREDRLKIVGGVYDLNDGRVDWLDT